jgi:hypothetical protein
MWSSLSNRQVFFSLVLLLSYSSLLIHFNLHRTRGEDSGTHCFKWQPVDYQSSHTYGCPHYSKIKSFVWRYDGTGLMKYIRWIVTRNLANIRITRLNNNCRTIQENHFSSDPSDGTFVQVYIMPLSTNLFDISERSKKIRQIADINRERMNHIYLKRESTKATIVFQRFY